MYDLIIIGGGPAAIAAGIYAARKKIGVLLISKEWGGQVAGTASVENYPGFVNVQGADLAAKFTDHLKRHELDIKENQKVENVEWISDRDIAVELGGEKHHSKTLIIATGRHPEELGLPTEREFRNKGISYCSICDAPLFKDKEVAVIGSGNAGLEAVFDLVNYASKIHLLEFLPQITGDKIYQERLREFDDINILTNVLVKEFKGDNFLKGLVYEERNTKEVKELSVSGVFVEVGTRPNSKEFGNVVELNEKKEIVVDSKNRTSKDNIFAAGDVTNVSHKQIAIAIGEGTKAMLNTYDYLNQLTKE